MAADDELAVGVLAAAHALGNRVLDGMGRMAVQATIATPDVRDHGSSPGAGR
jgi:hypothetical protein